jgi:copper(I)-binding protein
VISVFLLLAVVIGWGLPSLDSAAAGPHPPAPLSRQAGRGGYAAESQKNPPDTGGLGALEDTPKTTFVKEIVGAVPVSLQIRNDGDEPDRLLGGSTPIAERVEVHQSRLIDGQRMMGLLAEGLAIPAGSTVTLEPGSDHLMLIGLQRTLVQGDTFPLTLWFAQAGEVTVTGRVRRKVDAAGVAPIPPVTAGGLTVSLVSAPPAPAGTPRP